MTSARVSTKCRIVFDASAKTKSGKSLNDCLLPGPPLQQKITAVELRFRQRPVALIGDCKKMFLQVQVDPKDRPFLRFLWVDPQDPTAKLRVFQFKTLIFGATDSPFQAISCFQRLVKDRKDLGNMNRLDERVCDTIVRDTYVDDITTGGDDVADAYNVYKGITNFLARPTSKFTNGRRTLPPYLIKYLKVTALPLASRRMARSSKVMTRPPWG